VIKGLTRRKKIAIVGVAIFVQLPIVLVLGATGTFSAIGHVPVCHSPPWQIPAAVGLQLADCGHEPLGADNWDVEATIYTQEAEGGVIYLRAGSVLQGWGRRHIEYGHGWPEENGTNKNILDAIRGTIANPTTIERVGTKITFHGPSFLVAVQQDGAMGVITAFTPG